MDVLVGGPLPPNPADLVESERMRELLSGAVAQYDLVVLDTPPTSVVSDAIPLVKQVDGVIVVTRLGLSTHDSAVHLHNQLGHLNAFTLGVVVNGFRSDGAGYGYGYGYGYAPRDGAGILRDDPPATGAGAAPQDAAAPAPVPAQVTFAPREPGITEDEPTSTRADAERTALSDSNSQQVSAPAAPSASPTGRIGPRQAWQQRRGIVARALGWARSRSGPHP